MLKGIKLRKFILRCKSQCSDSDKYKYFISCKDGVEMVTPFKDKATVFIEGSEVKVVSKDWKFISI